MPLLRNDISSHDVKILSEMADLVLDLQHLSILGCYATDATV